MSKLVERESAIVHRDLILVLAARHRLPAVYPYRFFLTSGGLMFYGMDYADVFRRAAEYVNRILNGEKPADLPGQASTRYELVINPTTPQGPGPSPCRRPCSPSTDRGFL